jgi:DNA polymerase III delta prime subunit
MTLDCFASPGLSRRLGKMGSGLDESSAALGANPWRRLDSRVRWNDLVLPEELLGRLRRVPELYRSGPAPPGKPDAVGHQLCLLFGGSRGAGKTSSALALAGELNRPVLEADVRELLAGENAPELADRVLTKAAQLGAILVLDHADAALEPRKGAGARHYVVAAETSRLLRLDGLQPGPEMFILCVAHVRDASQVSGLRLDATFLFPEPDAAAREQIWAHCLPAGHRISGPDLVQLAEVFRLVGASIARCCATAERLARDAGAPVSLRYIAAALEEAYRGRLISDRTRAGLADLRLRAASAEAERPRELARTAAIEVPAAAGLRGSATPRRAISAERSLPAPSPGAPSRALPLRGARAVMIAIIVIGALVAAALGIAASSGDSPSTAVPLPLDRQATIGPARIAYPSNWRSETTATVSGHALSPGLTLVSPRSPSGRLVIGVPGQTGQGIPTWSIPAPLATKAAPQVVTLGARRFLRLFALGSAHENLYAAIATNPPIFAACQTSSSAFARDCERVLGTLVLRPVASPAPTTDPAYARQLSQVLSTLNQARGTVSHQLALARTGPEQARAAAKLAAAHVTAAISVSHLNAGAAAGVNRRLLAALQLTARAYGSLAAAATGANAGAYRTAQQAVRAANTSLSATLARLRTLGYVVR